jgi:aminopeptidase
VSAIIKREWWQIWEEEYPPECDFVIQSWDTAFTKSERADYSACTTWGVFYQPDDTGVTQANIILLNALKKRMDQADKVHIKGKGTDLRFSIKKIGSVTCGGEYNIPDGEVFSAPVKDSVEGVVQYNCPTIYQGVSFDNIRLVFKKGKIVEATSNNTKRLNEILDTDPGARYIGEFAIGFNPHILNPMQDILFDEKIAGSFHFTPGKCYEMADNGNNSSVHWDMVCIQRPEYGGGEIIFDGEVIRKDGMFIPKDLQKLNPAYLLGKTR